MERDEKKGKDFPRTSRIKDALTQSIVKRYILIWSSQIKMTKELIKEAESEYFVKKEDEEINKAIENLSCKYRAVSTQHVAPFILNVAKNPLLLNDDNEQAKCNMIHEMIIDLMHDTIRIKAEIYIVITKNMNESLGGIGNKIKEMRLTIKTEESKELLQSIENEIKEIRLRMIEEDFKRLLQSIENERKKIRLGVGAEELEEPEELLESLENKRKEMRLKMIEEGSKRLLQSIKNEMEEIRLRMREEGSKRLLQSIENEMEKVKPEVETEDLKKILQSIKNERKEIGLWVRAEESEKLLQSIEESEIEELILEVGIEESEESEELLQSIKNEIEEIRSEETEESEKLDCAGSVGGLKVESIEKVLNDKKIDICC